MDDKKEIKVLILGGFSGCGKSAGTAAILQEHGINFSIDKSFDVVDKQQSAIAKMNEMLLCEMELSEDEEKVSKEGTFPRYSGYKNRRRR